MEDERVDAVDLDELRQPVLLGLHVDVGVPRVPEHPEQPVDADVEARRLHQLRRRRGRYRCGRPRSDAGWPGRRAPSQRIVDLLPRWPPAPRAPAIPYTAGPGVHAVSIDGPERALPRSAGLGTTEEAAAARRGRGDPAVRRARARRRHDAGGQDGSEELEPATRSTSPDDAVVVAARPRPLPVEVRGVHVTGALASLPGKLAEYAALKRTGSTRSSSTSRTRAARSASRPPASRSRARPARCGATTRRARSRNAPPQGPLPDRPHRGASRTRTSPARAPTSLSRAPDGSIWTTSAGLAWVNPYDRRVWDYNISIAEAAAKAGFDEIMLDYTRFPSDGDVAGTVYPGRTKVSRAR